MITNPAGDWGVVAPTFGDARDVCIEGPSGLLKILGPHVALDGSGAPKWNRSMGELYLRNGSVVFITGADEGAPHIQGHNLRGVWCSEVGLWKKKWRMAWEESIRYAVRLEPAKIICDGTPKAGHPLVKLLMADGSVVCTGPLRMADNKDNLAPGLVEELIEKYAGTRIGRQELEGEILDEAEGALWSRDQIGAARVPEAPELTRIVVAVDPAASAKASSDETGIVVAGIGPCRCKGVEETHGFVLADRTCRKSPDGWGRRAVNAYRAYEADRIVAEVNNGGEMVEHVVKTIDDSASYKAVHASRSKQTRAEPVAALYEQMKVHHVGELPELEDQMVTWEPGDDSPDRMDALVWALTELMVQTPSAWRPL